MTVSVTGPTAKLGGPVMPGKCLYDLNHDFCEWSASSELQCFELTRSSSNYTTPPAVHQYSRQNFSIQGSSGLKVFECSHLRIYEDVHFQAAY